MGGGALDGLLLLLVGGNGSALNDGLGSGVLGFWVCACGSCACACACNCARCCCSWCMIRA